jgi:cellulose synthase/poly-beta-1,6-N-acetylglucosamine synthase-like glycosyltransferase
VVSDDEYISWCAQTIGYKVIYAPRAKVYTKDPMNLRDYLSKRKRILSGHFLIKNTLRYDVPTADMVILLPEFARLTLKNWKRIQWLAPMVLFELWCRLSAQVDALRKNVSPRYRVNSAKFSTRDNKKV